MPEKPDELQVRAIYAMPDERAMQIRTGLDSAVLSPFRTQIHLADPELTIAMTIVVKPGGRPLVRDFAVSPKDLDATITTRLLRKIPVDRLLRAALDKMSTKIQERPDIHPNAFQVEGEPETQAWVSPQPEQGRGRDVAPDRVARAAQLYQEALAAGSRAPAEAVAEALHYSRATAARDIRAARKRGLLPPVGETRADTGSARLSPPSSGTVSPNPIWQRFDDPESWASMDDVLEGPSGVPFYDPNAEGPAPAPVPGAGPGITTPDTWLQRIREAAAIPLEARDTSLSPNEMLKIMEDLAQAQKELKNRLGDAQPGADPENKNGDDEHSDAADE